MLHGFYLASFNIYKTVLPQYFLPRHLGIFLTLLAVTFAWVPFRIDSASEVWVIWQGMLGFNGFGLIESPWDLVFLGIVITLTLVIPPSFKRWPGSFGNLESFFIWAIAIAAIISAPQVSKFIYFQF